jgi:4a-hydroxytetrahydrobiopterin dehydratase
MMPRMDEQAQHAGRPISRQQASADVSGLGWRYILGSLRTCVRVGSLGQAASVTARVAATAGDEAGDRLRADIRADRVILTLRSVSSALVTARETGLAHRISASVRELGMATDAESGDGGWTPVQVVEIGIDALDIASVRPFWQAVLGYQDEPGASGGEGGLVDPGGQGPTVWFQQMDAPRPQRNRIHFDVAVPHDAVGRRIEGAIAAGGRLVYDAEAPAFWVLADAEGNEACITTWQGRE